nr:M48 family metalloprotease [uncultured Dyadobacter sp.]
MLSFRKYKNIHLVSMLSLVIFCINKCHAQVDEIGLFFQQTGYIQEINFEKKELVVNFSSKEGIFTETVLAVNPKTKLFVKGISDFQALRFGMEIEIVGDKMPKQGIVIASNIQVKEIPKKIKIEKGRLDDISGDFAIIDGNKVKMKVGGKISGDRKTLYKGKVFENFKQLKLGDYATVEGVYDPKGFALASEVKISPDLETKLDRDMRSVNDDSTFHNLFYDKWMDPVQRSWFLGKTYNGNPIANSISLQNYVQNMGSKMIPDFIKDKIKFMFVTLVDPEVNAFAQPDGLVIVNTGLLKAVENEAQLAAIIGHEITHAIYEHSANKSKNKVDTENRKKSNEEIINVAKDVAKVSADWVKLPKMKIPNVTKRTFKLNIDSLSDAFKTYEKAKEISVYSKYSVDNESQSDRVGLYLLTKSGYDPREAMKFWRNLFVGKFENVSSEEKRLVSGSQISSFSKMFDRYRKPPSASEVGIYFFKNQLKKKSGALNDEALYSNGQLKTHPSHVKRFELLNGYVNLYYSDPELIRKSFVGKIELAKILEKADDEMRAAEQKLFEQQLRQYAKRYNLDKAFSTSYEKIKLKLSSKDRTVLNYKGFKINSCLKVEELIGKKKCEVAGLKSLLNGLSESHRSEITTFVSAFKAGNVSPSSKNRSFAVHHETEKSYNDFVITTAARYQVCDVEVLNGIKTAIQNGSIKNYITPSNEAINEVYQHLESLKKEDSN